MGPLVVNDIISPDTNLLFAFLIGIGFGFVLESSGFSSSRKLAGVFYGYDTVVLKVFFTAAITAMIGMLFMSLFGWIDMDMVYINPTYLPSAIAGGVIMGAGFIMGGFCPGTSFCGMAIGKIDAMLFVVGLVLGVSIFTEGYSLWEDFYNAGFKGFPKMSDSFGMSDGILSFGIVIAAIGMFYIGEWAEKRFPRKEY